MLLQLAHRVKKGHHERQTHGQVAHTHGPWNSPSLIDEPNAIDNIQLSDSSDAPDNDVPYTLIWADCRPEHPREIPLRDGSTAHDVSNFLSQLGCVLCMCIQSVLVANFSAPPSRGIQCHNRRTISTKRLLSRQQTIASCILMCLIELNWIT